MAYMRNGRMAENRGPWPLYYIPGFNYVLDFLSTIVLFFTTMFSPGAATKIRRDGTAKRGAPGWSGGGGGGGGGGPGGPGGGSGGGPRISGMGNLPSGAAGGCCGRSCG